MDVDEIQLKKIVDLSLEAIPFETVLYHSQGCRLSEGASLGRERSRLGENAQDFELATGGFPLGLECLAWARVPTLGREWPRQCPERNPGNHVTNRLTVRGLVEDRPGSGEEIVRDDIEHRDARRDDFVSRWFVDKVLREGLGHWEDGWCKVDDHVIACIHCIVEVVSHGYSICIIMMDRNSTHIRGYHFTMSPEGQWNSDGYRYTYSGPCGLKVHMECAGSSMMIPHPDAVIDASFTLPLRRNPIPGMGVSFPPVQSDVAGPSSGRRTWPDVVDAPSSSRAFRSDGRGAGPCKKSPELRLSSPPNYASGIWHHDMELDDEEEDEVIELVEVESSVEVINLVSDSEEEEDPSEGSSIPGIF
ncbi:unnamed protein product [Lupinus luteus]|uniref:Uncharacterized protein n=1 Tax=Lupinus luteus TaxID=3873 RepID=A0AAV1WPJ0_LUPLU